MKPPPFAYVRPDCLDGALEQLNEAGDEGKVLAGGQSLVPLLNLRLSRPSVLVDIGRLEELQSVELLRDRLMVGAGVRQLTVERTSLIAEHCPLLAGAVRHIGHLQIRSRGTLGGSMSHADPAAELPTAAVALDATFHIASKRGERSVDAHDFFLGPFMTALEADEVLTAVSWPCRKQKAVFVEATRRPGDFADVGVALWLTFQSGDVGVVADIGIAVCGLTGAPLRLADVEGHVRGQRLTAHLAETAGGLTSEHARRLGTVADSDYRSRVAGTLVARSLAEVAS